MSEHSIIPPSSAGIFGAPGGCTGWVKMSQQYPESENNQDAKEGDASHEIGARLILAASRGNHAKPSVKTTTKETASNGVVFTNEMFEAAEIYANDVESVMRDRFVFNPSIEQRIKCPEIHDLSEGTPDNWLYDANNLELFLWDYKYGHGVVEVFENWQAINYLSGIANVLYINGITDQNITVHIRIAQPRAFHKDGAIREWVVKLSDMRGYWNILSANAHEALSENATIRSGPHCRYCNARHACPAALKAGLSLYEIAMNPTPVDLTPNELGIQLAIVRRALSQLEYLETGFSEQAKILIRKGTLVQNFMGEMGKGRKRWNAPASEIITLGKLLKFDLKKPDEAITPTKAAALGIDGEVIKQYSETPSTGFKVIPDNGSKAKLLFGAKKP